MEVVSTLPFLFILHFLPNCCLSANLQTVYPTKIANNADCSNFVKSIHRFGRVVMEYNDGTHKINFGDSANMEKCAGKVRAANKILILAFRKKVPEDVIKGLAEQVNSKNMWLSFLVAPGPNCNRFALFKNQTVEPFNGTIVGFCEGESSPPYGYNKENLRSLLEKMSQIQEFGTLYGQLNGQIVLDSSSDVDWSVITKRVEVIVIQRRFKGLKRREVLRVLEIEENRVIWDDFVDEGRRLKGSAFILALAVSVLISGD